MEGRLDAEHVVAVGAEVEVRARQHRRRRVDHQARHRGQQHHAHEARQRVHVRAAQDVAGLLERGALELVERRRLAFGPAEEEIAQAARRGLGEDQQRAPREVAEHVEQDRRDDLARLAEQVGDLLEPDDGDRRHADHDPPVGHLRQRGRGVAGADVLHFLERVQLERLEIADVVHASGGLCR